MNAIVVLHDADYKLDHNEITLEEYLKLIKPLEDVVPVIRCENCTFWDRDHISRKGFAKCRTGEGGIRYRNRSDFCSKGARMDGNGND